MQEGRCAQFEAGAGGLGLGCGWGYGWVVAGAGDALVNNGGALDAGAPNILVVQGLVQVCLAAMCERRGQAEVLNPHFRKLLVIESKLPGSSSVADVCGSHMRSCHPLHLMILLLMLIMHAADAPAAKAAATPVLGTDLGSQQPGSQSLVSMVPEEAGTRGEQGG